MAAKPTRLVDPTITLGDTPTDLSCFAYGASLLPEEDNDASTFCDPEGSSWVLTLRLRQSVGTDGLWDALAALGDPGDTVPFTLAYKSDPAGPENPVATGMVKLRPVPFMDADVNGYTSFDYVLDLIDPPTYDVTPPVSI